MEEETEFSLYPASFFALACDCHYIEDKSSSLSQAKYELPDTYIFSQRRKFADVAMGWNETGLKFHIKVNRPFSESFYPDLVRGDSIELLIDTRDMKSAGSNTRFCHHFYFLPKPVEDHFCGEITHFRTEDSHPLCQSSLLFCKTKFGSNFYAMEIFIPKECLYGYDPSQFDRLGFTYRINLFGGDSQEFSVLSEEFSIDQQPALWSSMKLIV